MNEDFKELISSLIVGIIILILLAVIIFGGIVITSKVELENDKERMELEYQYEIKYKALENNFENIEIYDPAFR